jgi:GNAT superfamily N-acetyltransferase
LFGPDELAAVGFDEPAPGTAIADEWWRVTDDGLVVGYGWLDSEWGDAQIALLVDRDRRGAGLGNYILDRLEDEAAGRGLNYIYNVVPDTHPDAARMTRWLIERGFTHGTGDLRRHIHSGGARTWTSS